jgi:dihydrofolate synthase / folylpolyglutamate synthase
MVPGEPLIVLDTAHNAASAAALAATLHARGEASRTLVVACSKDKDYAAIAQALVPVFDRIVITEYQNNPRAVPRDELAQVFRAATCRHPHLAIEVAPTPVTALEHALRATPPAGLVCITGSFFLTAELRPVVLTARQT